MLFLWPSGSKDTDHDSCEATTPRWGTNQVQNDLENKEGTKHGVGAVLTPLPHLTPCPKEENPSCGALWKLGWTKFEKSRKYGRSTNHEKKVEAESSLYRCRIGTRRYTADTNHENTAT